MAKLTEKFAAKIEATVHKVFEGILKSHDEEVNALKYEISQLKESQDFVCAKYENLKKSYEILAATNTKQEKEMSEIKVNSEQQLKKISEESSKLDNLEMYGRRQNLEFEGIPFLKNENVNQIIMDLTKSIGIEIKEQDISIAHRLPQKPNYNRRNLTKPKPATVIARFTNRSVRNDIYHRRTAFKSISKFPVEGMQHLFINENLTQTRKELFWRTKQKAKELGYRYIWTNNGQIYLRKDVDADAIAIHYAGDLDKL